MSRALRASHRCLPLLRTVGDHRLVNAARGVGVEREVRARKRQILIVQQHRHQQDRQYAENAQLPVRAFRRHKETGQAKGI